METGEGFGQENFVEPSLATATRELHPDGVPKLVKEALLTTRNLSGEGTVNVVSGVVGAGVGIISCAAAVGTWHYARKSMRDKSQADIQLENLRERQTRHVEGLARREAELNLRTREQAAVEERLNERNREQQRCERALDRRSRVNDARESVISRSERGEDSSRRDEREWALNDRSRYLERREDDLRRRRDRIAFDTQNLETALEKQRKEGVAHEQRLEERLQNYRAKLHRINYQAVLQEIVAAGKTRILRDERKAFETIAKPLRDLIALQVEHKVAEQERLKVFEMKMQTLCDREQGIVAQQESIDVAREDVDLTRQALERQYKELADWHGDVQKQVNQAQDKTEKQKKRLTKYTQEFEAAEREITNIRGDLRKREKDMLQKEAAIDKRGLMLNKEKGAAATTLSELEVREQKCQELLMKMQRDIEHLELNRTTK